MKLFGSLASPYTRKVRIVLAEKKIEYDFEIDNPWKADAKAAKLNPLGKVPALLLDDGRTLFDSRVIVGFLDNASPIARLVPAERLQPRRHCGRRLSGLARFPLCQDGLEEDSRQSRAGVCEALGAPIVCRYGSEGMTAG